MSERHYIRCIFSILVHIMTITQSRTKSNSTKSKLIFHRLYCVFMVSRISLLCDNNYLVIVVKLNNKYMTVLYNLNEVSSFLFFKHNGLNFKEIFKMPLYD